MNNTTGVYGKLPAHGDFIYRNLPTQFINRWDQWLQGLVSASQEQLGDQWLDIYLTSPVWRFSLAAGVVDDNVWAGVVLPSVDRVGRYFPFSIVTALHNSVNAVEFIATQTHWFETIESIALQALEGHIDVNGVVEALNNTSVKPESTYAKVPQNSDTIAGAGKTQFNMVVDMDFEEQSPATVFPNFVDDLLVNYLSSYSIWSTRGSERLSPCVFFTQGFPQINGIAAMLDGRWENWQWRQPFRLRTG